jgi:hypothetical protein
MSSMTELQLEFARKAPLGHALSSVRKTGASRADGQQVMGATVVAFQQLGGDTENEREALHTAYIAALAPHADGNVESHMHTINAILIPQEWIQLYADGLNARAVMARFLMLHIQVKPRAEIPCAGTFNKAFFAGQQSRRQDKDVSEVAAVVTAVLSKLTPEAKDGSR